MYSFALILGVGASAGLLWSVIQSPASRAVWVARAGGAALLGAAVGGRAGYLAVNWGYYSSTPGTVLGFPLGGLTWPGALAGSLAAVALAGRAARRPAGDLADHLMPLFASLTAAAWLACWVDGCAYGVLSDAWWAAPGRDEWGNVLNRFPVQLVGALAVIGLAWIADLLRRRPLPAGGPAAFTLAGFGAVMGLLIPYRADLSPMWRGFRLDALAAWGCALLFGAVFLITLARSRTGSDPASLQKQNKVSR